MSPSVSPVTVSFKFRDGANIAGVQFADLRQRLPLHDLDMLHAFLRTAIEIRDRCVILQHAAFYFEIVDSSGKRVGHGLEHKKRKRLRVVIFPFHTFAFASRLCVTFFGVLIRMRKNIGKERQQATVPDVMRSRNHQHRNNLFRDDRLAHAGNQILDGNRPLAEKLLHQLIVAFGHHLYQPLVRFFGIFCQRGGNFVDLRFAVSVRRIKMRFHRNQVNYAAKSTLRPNR